MQRRERKLNNLVSLVKLNKHCGIFYGEIIKEIFEDSKDSIKVFASDSCAKNIVRIILFFTKFISE